MCMCVLTRRKRGVSTFPTARKKKTKHTDLRRGVSKTYFFKVRVFVLYEFLENTLVRVSKNTISPQ